MFVLYAESVHVQCYRGWYVETGYVNTIFGKLHKIKYSYEALILIWRTQDLPRRFKEWKACFVEIRQTAHKLETNARANFPIAENLEFQCMENGRGETYPRLYICGTLWL